MNYSIGIAGAGIGGLTAAALLAKQGHQVAVFDQFDTPKPVGSGLVIQPVGQDVLSQIGALDAALATGRPITRMAGHEVDSGRSVLDVTYNLNHPAFFGLAIHRGALFQAILDAAKHAGARLKPDAKVLEAKHQLIETDKDQHGPFDLIIDATGAGSPLSPLLSKPLPYGALWATVDWPYETGLPDNELRQAYRKASRMIGAMPIGKPELNGPEKATIFWSLPCNGLKSWQSAGLQRWKDEAIALWPEIAPFVDQIQTPADMTFAQYSHGTLRRPYGAGIVHIGDAAHRASPQLGQGANMAMLDALAIAKAIQSAPLSDVGQLYAKARRLHVGIYQAMSAAFTPQYQSNSNALPILRDRILFPLSRIHPIPRILSTLVCGTMVKPIGKLQ
ncbi:2-polyprenyl-6-methoxyphenol hydroxylase [Cognatiyoonia sediminum]|uniref:2-polyprenyl-6-methoxyphenol hydroxylase n=1 Tax=Cognatiyoonia sediminum TaxID=1508389 RepID=A0A1M5NER3_9RHOB|nr:NAD(P)/FAD-dependent oxidoreductase [Cognatiyoonia sediminum]SHG88020.1 2-polyprenyl-6-methoxyphenol hydroxylase [Cognatiyoonia sediminum]